MLDFIPAEIRWNSVNKVVGAIAMLWVMVLLLIFIMDSYMYPICPRCGDNTHVETAKPLSRRRICALHGSFTVRRGL